MNMTDEQQEIMAETEITENTNSDDVSTEQPEGNENAARGREEQQHP